MPAQRARGVERARAPQPLGLRLEIGIEGRNVHRVHRHLDQRVLPVEEARVFGHRRRRADQHRARGRPLEDAGGHRVLAAGLPALFGRDLEVERGEEAAPPDQVVGAKARLLVARHHGARLQIPHVEELPPARELDELRVHGPVGPAHGEHVDGPRGRVRVGSGGQAVHRGRQVAASGGRRPLHARHAAGVEQKHLIERVEPAVVAALLVHQRRPGLEQKRRRLAAALAPAPDRVEADQVLRPHPDEEEEVELLAHGDGLVGGERCARHRVLGQRQAAHRPALRRLPRSQDRDIGHGGDGAAGLEDEPIVKCRPQVVM